MDTSTADREAVAWNLRAGGRARRIPPKSAKTSSQSGTYLVDVIATDNGLPPPSATNTFTLTVTPSPLTVSVAAGGRLQLSFTGAPLATYAIQATESFAPTNWHIIQVQLAGTNGLFNFIDTNAPSYPSRFYRAVGP